MMTPYEVQEKYNTAERNARKEVRDYWAERFRQEGLTVTIPTDYRWKDVFTTSFNGYDLSMRVYPSHYQGVKVTIGPPSPIWPYLLERKIQSDSGFKKFMRQLHNKEFVV